jgi:hypothetical protein
MENILFVVSTLCTLSSIAQPLECQPRFEEREWPFRFGEKGSSSYSWELSCVNEGKLCSATIELIPYFAFPEQAQIRPRLPSLSPFVLKVTVAHRKSFYTP